MLPFTGRLLILWTITGIGCSSNVPQAIRGNPAEGALKPVSVAQVQHGAGSYSGQRVRWGGSIIAVRNLSDSTEIEVLSRPLDGDGEPRADADGAGRFIARVTGFVDPAEYAKDRLLTVLGLVAGIETREVGEYPYRYPLIAVSSRYLWPELESDPYPYGFPWPYGGYGYDPWYGPGFGRWYGPGVRPWYGPW